MSNTKPTEVQTDATASDDRVRSLKNLIQKTSTVTQKFLKNFIVQLITPLQENDLEKYKNDLP